jgi:CHAT domain-containing protein
MPVNRVVLAEYFITDEITLLFFIRDDFDEPEVIEIPRPVREIREFVLVNFKEQRDENDRVLIKTGEMIQQLDDRVFQEFFEPFVAPLISESRKGGPVSREGDLIWIVPHDMLHYIPLHAVKVEGRYLIDRNPVCYTPSASVMKYCRTKRKGRREKGLVLADSRDDLWHAREEAVTIAGLFGTTPYLGLQATKSLLKEKLETDRAELDILHFSCHGYFDASQPLRSGIMLAAPQDAPTDDAKWNLTAEEIFGLRLEADLVTLSACESGVNQYRLGDELIGLTRALIYAGTPSVLVSLWAVDDLSTNLLMRHFYQQLAGSTKAEALRAAQSYVRDLTAKDVIGYCERRLAELNGPEDARQIILFQLDRANAQVAAGDLQAAIASYREIGPRLKQLARDQAERLSEELDNRLRLLEFKSEVSPAIDYNARPFESMYYWAAFILVGDWK